MKNISDTSKKIYITLLLLTLAVFAAGAVLIVLGGGFYMAEGVGSYALGLIVGYVFSVIKLYLTEKSLGKCLEMDKEGASTYNRFMYMFRYFLTFAVLAAAALIKQISLLGTILAVLLVQPAALIVSVKEKSK